MGRDFELSDGPKGTGAPCAFCRVEVPYPESVPCPRCRVIYHPECWTANSARCTVYGCEPPVEPPSLPAPEVHSARPQARQGTHWGVITLFLIGISGLLRFANQSRSVEVPFHPVLHPVRNSGDWRLPAEPRTAEEFRQRAIERQGREDLEGAIADFTQAIDLDPRNEVLRNDLGTARRKSGDISGAMREYTLAVEANPGYSRAYTNRAHLRYNLQDWAGALEDFTEVLALDRTDTDYERMRIWLIRSRLGNRPEANRELSEWFRGRLPAREDDWKAQLAAYLIGTLTEADLLRGSGRGDTNTVREQECEATFYIGSKHLLNGNNKRAVEFLKRCVGTGVTNFREYTSAAAQLKLLE